MQLHKCKTVIPFELNQHSLSPKAHRRNLFIVVPVNHPVALSFGKLPVPIAELTGDKPGYTYNLSWIHLDFVAEAGIERRAPREGMNPSSGEMTTERRVKWQINGQ